MQKPKFTLQDVRYADGATMFARAQELLRSGKVRNVHGGDGGYSATVHGTKPYDVSVSGRRVDEGCCNCYMGENDTLCKHMLALALAVLSATGGLMAESIPTDLKEAKRRVSAGMQKLRAYNGPSRTWGSYQRGLDVGVGMISEAIVGLPPSKQHADYLWNLVRRLSNKLATSGIDDSNGTVGDCVGGIVDQLSTYARKAPKLRPTIAAYCDDDTGFGFEDGLRDHLA